MYTFQERLFPKQSPQFRSHPRRINTTVWQCSQTTITLTRTAKRVSQLMSTKQQWRQERDDVRH